MVQFQVKMRMQFWKIMKADSKRILYKCLLLMIVFSNTTFAQTRIVTENINDRDNYKTHVYKFSVADMYFVLSGDTIFVPKIAQDTFMVSDAWFNQRNDEFMEIIVVTEKKVFSAKVHTKNFLEKSPYRGSEYDVRTFLFHRPKGYKNLIITSHITGLSSYYMFEFKKRNQCFPPKKKNRDNDD